MTTDPRAALDRLMAAFEAHLTAAQQGRGEDDPGVALAFDTLADAFDTYEEALYAATGETTPLEVYDGDDDLDDDDDDEDLDDEDDDLEDDLDDEDDEDDLDDDFDDDDDHFDDDLELEVGAPEPS